MSGDAQDDYDATAELKGRPTTAERERSYAAAVEHLAWAPTAAVEPTPAPTRVCETPAARAMALRHFAFRRATRAATYFTSAKKRRTS